MVRMVSDSGSLTSLCMYLAPYDTPSPTKTPPPNCSMNPVTASTSGWAEAVIPARTTLKRAMPVASLKAASVSIKVESLEGTLTLLKISMTVATSVGAITVANRSAE